MATGKPRKLTTPKFKTGGPGPKPRTAKKAGPTPARSLKVSKGPMKGTTFNFGARSPKKK